MADTSHRDGSKRVAVLGTGVIGAMAAWRLAARGAEVLAFDRFDRGHDRGASAGESRIFRTVYAEGGEYVPLLRRALRLWRELEARTGRSLLTMCGGLTIGAPDHEMVRAVLASAAETGVDHDVLDDFELARRFPQHHADPGEIGVFDPAAGVMRPEPAVQAAIELAESGGARFLPYHEVSRVRQVGSGWRIEVADAEFSVDHVVFCPGPWAPRWEWLRAFPIQPKKLTAYWFPARDVAAHQPDRLPIAVRRNEAGGFSCFPVLDGVSVKIIPHHLPFPAINDPDELPRGSDPEHARAASAAVARLLPGLVPAPIRVGTYVDGYTPDTHAIVGALPGASEATVLTGFSGHGFKLSPTFGEIAADLVIDGKTSFAIDHLSPERF